MLHSRVKVQNKKKKTWSRAHAGLCSIVDPLISLSYMSSLGDTLHLWALHIIIGSYPSSLDCTHHCWALHFIVEPHVASSDPPPARLAPPPLCHLACPLPIVNSTVMINNYIRYWASSRHPYILEYKVTRIIYDVLHRSRVYY